MIQRYAQSLAGQMGIQLINTTVVEGREVGCLDVHLLHMFVSDQRVSALVYQSEMDELQREGSCERLDIKIRAALARLGKNQVSESTPL
jgi:hypothetical protein